MGHLLNEMGWIEGAICLACLGGIVLFVRLFWRRQKQAAFIAAQETLLLDLEQRVKQRTAELTEANKLLQQEMNERKQTEQDLVRFERLRALGELSAGISHNLNNLLTGILGPAELLDIVSSDPKTKIYTEMIIQSANRAADIVARLYKAVDADPVGTLERVSVDMVSEEAISVTRPRWKDEAEANGIAIEVVTSYKQTAPIRGTEAELGEILINLIFNAVDAMPSGGKLTIDACDGDDADQVILNVSDTGIGMSDIVKKRVFEPFFTTKKDVGSGLGLASVYGIVRRWGASIDVTSAPEQGTTFTLKLPTWKGAETDHVEAELDVLPVSTTQKRILVVDDEDVVCRIIALALSKNHEVDTAAGGKEALDMFERKGYDIALIDLGMPGMSGDRVAQAIKKRDDRVVTVMVTGWALEEKDARLTYFDDVVTKPFETLDVIRHAVGRAAALHDQRLKEE